MLLYFTIPDVSNFNGCHRGNFKSLMFSDAFVRFHFLIYAIPCWILICLSLFWITKNLGILSCSPNLIIFQVILLMIILLKEAAILRCSCLHLFMTRGKFTCAFSYFVSVKLILYILLLFSYMHVLLHTDIDFVNAK